MPHPNPLPAHFKTSIDTQPWPEAAGVVRRDDVVAVSATGVRYHGSTFEETQLQVTRWLQDMAGLRIEAEVRRELYVPSVGATNAGGVVAEMELLDASRQ